MNRLVARRRGGRRGHVVVKVGQFPALAAADEADCQSPLKLKPVNLERVAGLAARSEAGSQRLAGQVPAVARRNVQREEQQLGDPLLRLFLVRRVVGPLSVKPVDAALEKVVPVCDLIRKTQEQLLCA